MGGHQGILVAGRYHLISESGRGGRGTVWRAHDDLLDREVAIKEVRLSPWADADERRSLCRRLIAEARATAALRHPGLVTVFDVVQQDGRPWIVMEFVEAPSLQEVIDRAGRLPPRRAAEIGHGVLSALRAAHEAGILHRDVKPSNVLLPADGRILLTDFGLAIRMADCTGGLPSEGSPAYVSPEQAWSRPVTEASDLWSFGATLYAAVEGHAPYGRCEPLASLVAVLIDDYEPPEHAGPLRPVIDGLLRRDPAERATAAETARRLGRLIHGTGTGTGTGSSRRRPVRSALTGLVAVGFAGLLAGGDGGFWPEPSDLSATTLTLQAKRAVHADDMVRHDDPAGFSIEVPAGWRRSAVPTGTAWYDPIGHGSLRVCRVSGDPLTGLRAAEQQALTKGTYPGYRRLRLEQMADTGQGAGAEWEFTWRDARGMRTRSGDHDLYFVSPHDRWTPALRGYEVIRRTFRPGVPPAGDVAGDVAGDDTGDKGGADGLARQGDGASGVAAGSAGARGTTPGMCPD